MKYMIVLTAAAYIGWKMLNEAAEQFDDALLNPTDYSATVDAMEQRYVDLRLEAHRRSGYLNPDKLHLSTEEF